MGQFQTLHSHWLPMGGYYLSPSYAKQTSKDLCKISKWSVFLFRSFFGLYFDSTMIKISYELIILSSGTKHRDFKKKTFWEWLWRSCEPSISSTYQRLQVNISRRTLCLFGVKLDEKQIICMFCLLFLFFWSPLPQQDPKKCMQTHLDLKLRIKREAVLVSFINKRLLFHFVIFLNMLQWIHW